jgi:hypothetical protein
MGGAQCLIEVIRSSGEMWRVDAYQIPYYIRGIEGEKDEGTESVDIATNENILLLDEYSKVKLF